MGVDEPPPPSKNLVFFLQETKTLFLAPATIVVVPSAAVVIHTVPTLFRVSPILGTLPFLRRGGGVGGL